MINRFFFITDLTAEILWPETAPPLSADQSPETNIFFAIQPELLNEKTLKDAYTRIENSPVPMALAFRPPLTQDQLRFVTSFLFLPSYLYLNNRPVILLIADSQDALESSMSLCTYLETQGINDPFVPVLLPAGQWDDLSLLKPGCHPLFSSTTSVLEYHTHLLKSDVYYNNSIFYYAMDGVGIQMVKAELIRAEKEFQQRSSRSYELASAYNRLEKEYNSLVNQHTATLSELSGQKQYIELLRSDHQAREIQEYYDREYEVLPLWYKRLGHIIKVLAGKRTFRSLYRDDVKKYKD